jgi:uncharacterized membrane protein (DUF2068 family)
MGERHAADGYDPDPSRHPGLHLIALFEAMKGSLALLSAGGIELLGPAPIRHLIVEMTTRLHLHPDRGPIAHMLAAVNLHVVHLTALMLFGYACLRFIEAWGLWRARAWASWLGLVSAVLYLPLDISALWRHPGWLAAGVLAINLIVVWVLTRDLRVRRR